MGAPVPGWDLTQALDAPGPGPGGNPWRGPAWSMPPRSARTGSRGGTPESTRVWQRRVLASTEPVTVAELRLAVGWSPWTGPPWRTGRGATFHAASAVAGPGRGVEVRAARR
jgi:hypothetical protein